MSVISNISRILNIRPEERTAVFLLLGQTVFLGVFLALFDISTTSLFINTFGESMISRAFLVSGILGFALSAVYYRLQSVWKFSKLIILNLLTISIITFLLRSSFYLSESEGLIFTAFILMGPLNLLGVIGFWGMAGRLFTLRQGKRLFGLIDAGQIFGMILISFLVPVLLNILNTSKDLLFISAISVFLAFIIQMVIVRKFNLDQQHNIEKAEKKLMVADLFRNRYIRSMTFYVAFSVLAAFFMFYIFLPTTKMLYPGDREYTVFLGMFTGTLMIFTILIKTFAYDKITKNYGLKVSLLLPPLLLGLFVLLGIAAGEFFGISPESTSFVLFFLFVALGRLFSVSLKNAIETPSQKILYQSLDKSIRYKVQVAIDGMVNESAAVLAGLVLFVMGALGVFNVIHHAYLLIAIVGAWATIAYFVYKQYRASLGATLETETETIVQKKAEKINQDLLNYEGKTKEGKRKKLQLIKESAPTELTGYYRKCLLSNDQDLQDWILSDIDDNIVFELIPDLKKFATNTKDQKLGQKATHIAGNLEEMLELYKNEAKIKALVESAYPEERIKAARIIAHSETPTLARYIIILLRDYSPKVRIAAIEAAAKLKEPNSRAVIIDLLAIDQYNLHCFEALKKYGKDALDELEQFFYKSGLDQYIQLQIIELFESIGKKATNYLINKLELTNQEIIKQTLNALIKINYKPRNETEKQKLIDLLKEQIRVIAWNMNISINLSVSRHGTSLINAFEAEKKTVETEIHTILEIIYNKQSLAHVRQNLDQATSESISYAIELLDLFADEEIKPLLFTLFEDISESEKVRRFQDQFPLNRISEESLVLDIINRDINFISRYTKACALNSLWGKEIAASATTIAQVFNSDILLNQLAIKTLANSDKNKYHELLQRLDRQDRLELEKTVMKKTNQTIYEIINQSKDFEIFKNLSSNEVSNLIELSAVYPLKENDELKFESPKLDFIIVISGTVETQKNDIKTQYYQGDVIATHDHGDLNELKIKAKARTIVLYVPFILANRYMTSQESQSSLISRII
ncbi:MAG TPA: HEAT repeat domain-containing protein [Salinivirga sp.]|uniref:HEAT repeat domain-containing protein n=1 Tax=Salinivirga sp. TaxID=1970192 RepID=UPI002B479E72|nr:HEAT repeat domain-containing protein [Salinivirga sp.]HKK59490.1 HEAT repeat domain-containing protein [Salinivirga sp.]